MDRLFVEAAGNRRRFFDRLVYGLDPDHAGRIAAYEQAMRERARLLRDGRRDPAWLGTLEATMAARGVAIAAARLGFASQLKSVLAAGGHGFPKARIAIEGEVEAALAGQPALAVEDGLARRLAENRGIDADTGTTRAGVHRTDLAVTHEGNGMPAARCSTGEQKALLLALVLGGYGFETIGLSPELGALVFGAMLANHPRSQELAKSLWSVKEVFLVGFFLQIGIEGLPDHQAMLFALVAALVLPLKGALFFFLLLAFRLRSRSAFLSSLALTNYSEFGLIVASIALPEWLVPLAISVSLSFVISAPLIL